MEGIPLLTHPLPEEKAVEDYVEDLLEYSFDDAEDEGAEDYSDL
ncbi:hypothetical protein [Marinimicrobium agarilyticum]|nr:hypothetical protein [Marinimicrobium agarilyticum]